MSKQAIIIEDDLNSAKVLAHLLAKESIESTIVTDPGKLKEDMNPSIIFVDLEMPRMNGYEVLAVLQKIPRYRPIPIIASSVHTGEVNRVREAGFHSFIGKPLSKDRFPHQLQRILSGENVWETV